MTRSRPPTVALVAALAAAVLAISSAAVLARAADAADPRAVAWWRVAGTAALLAPFLRRPSPRDLGRLALAGALLGAHFATWFISLRATTVLHSTVLVCLSPVWAGLAERWRAGHLPRPAFWAGIGMAVLGAALLAGDDDGRATLHGDALATVSGMLAAGYLVIGSAARERVDLVPYMGWTAAFAALALLPVTAGAGVPLSGWDATTWALLAGSVAVPQAIGHGGLNWALRWLPPPTVSSVVLLEPVGAAILAWWVLGEIPGRAAIAGCAACVVGVAVANRTRAGARLEPMPIT